MLDFKINKISPNKELVGNYLRAEREKKNLNLKDISLKINIKPEYLSALENGNHDSLPGGVYEKTFLKKYSSFLGLDQKKINKLYAQEKTLLKKVSKNIFSNKVTSAQELLVFPKIIRTSLIVFFVLALFSYLGFYLKNSLSLPNLEIYTPADNLVTNNYAVDIKGQTATPNQIMINGELLLKDDLGNFKENVSLKKGLNEITITAQNKYGREKIIKKQILVK